MNPQRSSSFGRRSMVAVVSALLFGLTAAGPALAAAPANDDIGSPTVVAALPYGDGPYDTTEATIGSTDPGFCYDPSVKDKATVWYSFTPGISDRYLADTFGSDYDTTLYIGTPDGSGGIDVIACNDDVGSLQSAVTWDGEAGTTYLLMVGTYPGAESGGGNLVFHLDVAPPPPTIHVTVLKSGSFTPYGVATIRGTISCTNVQWREIDVTISQRVGRFVLRGGGYDFADDCSSSPTPWAIEVSSWDGKFAGGQAQVEVFAFGCGALECAEGHVATTVTLRR